MGVVYNHLMSYLKHVAHQPVIAGLIVCVEQRISHTVGDKHMLGVLLKIFVHYTYCKELYRD